MELNWNCLLELPMASIASQVKKLKSMIRTPADVEELFALLGNKSELLDELSVSRIPSDGKVHVFLKKFPKKADVICVKSSVWANLHQYKNNNAEINDIINEDNYEDHIDSYRTIMGSTRKKCEKVTFKNWQKYAEYSSTLYNTEFNDDVTGECPWYADGDHKDPGYNSYAKIPVYLYFRKSNIDDIQGDEVDVFFEKRSDILTCDVERNGDSVTLVHRKEKWTMEDLATMNFLVCKS